MLQRNHFSLWLALLFFALLFIAGWPFYKYIFDSDAIGYLTVARHYADGRWNEAVNGYWSPMHSWLAAPFVAAGFYELHVFKALNGCIGVLILLLFHRYLRRYNFTIGITGSIMLAAVVIVLHYAYFEVAADLLLVLFLLLYFLISATTDFVSNRKLNLLAGAVAAAAYFSKTYAFAFFLLHFSYLHWISPQRHYRNWIFGIALFLLMAFPWLVALHYKYGIWTFGTSGKLNWSTYLIYERNPDLLFFAPPYEKSVAWWEDPYLYQKNFYTPFQSIQLFLHQCKLFLYNIQQWLIAISKISYLLPFTFLLVIHDGLMVRNFLSKKLSIWAFLLPSGYLLIHIETRFLWILALLFLPWLMQWWKVQSETVNRPKWVQYTFFAIIIFSFLFEPVNQLKNSLNQQKQWALQARILKEKGIKGNCITFNRQLDEGMIVAYQAGLRYYMPGSKKDFLKEVLPATNQFDIRWFLFFFQSEAEKLVFEQSDVGSKLPNPVLMQQGMLVYDLAQWSPPSP